jgi:DNA-binding response OmpR family regulator
MPRMNGIQLAERVVALRPGTPVVFMSGHSEEFVHRAGVPADAPLIQKPFSRAELAARLQAVVSRSSR